MRIGVVAALVLVVAACGGSGRMSKEDFETHLKNDAMLASRAAANASTAAGNTSRQYAARVARAQKEMHSAAADLDAITPPKDAEADVDKLVRGLGFLDKQLKTLRHAAATGNSVEARKVSDAVSSSPEVHAIDGAIKDLQRKGYDVGVFGS
jgi:hypothetical protein